MRQSLCFRLCADRPNLPGTASALSRQIVPVAPTSSSKAELEVPLPVRSAGVPPADSCSTPWVDVLIVYEMLSLMGCLS